MLAGIAITSSYRKSGVLDGFVSICPRVASSIACQIGYSVEAQTAMAETLASGSPTAMEGQGAYNRNSRVQAGVLSPALTMAVDDNGEFGYGPVLDAMYSTLLEMVDSGFLLAEELQRMAIPTVGRSRADFVAPFGANGRFSGLCLEEIEIFFGEDKIWSDFLQHRDPLTFAAQWAAFSRASVFPALIGSLDGGHTRPRASAFSELLENGMRTRLAAEPHPILIPLGRLLVAKET